MRRLTKQEINKFKKLKKKLDAEIRNLFIKLEELIACKVGIESYIKTKKAYQLEDLKIKSILTHSSSTIK